MSSPPPVELFTGTSWEECHKFILAIRTRAMWEGKQRDPAWMADFAASYFWHKALVWHCRLPEDVCQDWSKLQIALVERWPPPEDDDGPQLEPTPAPAPPLNRNDKQANFTFQGALKLVIDGVDTPGYVEFSGQSICSWTSNMNKALRVRCDSLSGTTLLELIGHSSHSWLAVRWHLSAPKIGNGSSDYAHIPCADSNPPKPSGIGEGPMQLMTCIVLANNEVIPVWGKDDGSNVTLYAFVNESYIYLAADPKAYSERFQAEKRARLFIEPTD